MSVGDTCVDEMFEMDTSTGGVLLNDVYAYVEDAYVEDASVVDAYDRG